MSPKYSFPFAKWNRDPRTCFSFAVCGANEGHFLQHRAFKVLIFSLSSYWLAMKCAGTDLRMYICFIGTCPWIFHMRQVGWYLFSRYKKRIRLKLSWCRNLLQVFEILRLMWRLPFKPEQNKYNPIDHKYIHEHDIMGTNI